MIEATKIALITSFNRKSEYGKEKLSRMKMIFRVIKESAGGAHPSGTWLKKVHQI